MSKNKVSSSQDRRIWTLIIAMIAVLGLSIPLGASLFGIRFDYTLTIVTLGGAILGMISGVLGSFAVLRQESLMGDALSHAALPGVAIAFLLFGRDLGVLLIGAGIVLFTLFNYYSKRETNPYTGKKQSIALTTNALHIE